MTDYRYYQNRISELAYENGKMGMELQIVLAALQRVAPHVAAELIRVHGLKTPTPAAITCAELSASHAERQEQTS